MPGRSTALRRLVPRALRGNRRERRSAETRERLYRAALQLFAERGYPATTVEDITEAADVGKGTFFNYFPTKEHVLARYGAERIQAVERARREALRGERAVLEVLGELAGDLAGQSSERPALLRAIYAAHASCDAVRAELRKRLMRGRELLADIYRAGQRRGEVRRDLSASELSRLTQIVFLGVTLSWSMNPDTPSRKTAAMVWELLCPSLRAAAKRASRGL